jgi:hypothetical protein
MEVSIIKYCLDLYGLAVDGSDSDVENVIEHEFEEAEYANEDLYDDWEMFYRLRDHLENIAPIILENEMGIKIEFSERNGNIIMAFLNG